MRLTYFISVMCTTLLLSVSVANAGVIGKPMNQLGLIGYWSFNEGSGTSAGDSSGRKLNATLNNSPLWASGKIGAAIDFNGDNKEVDTPFTDSPTVTTISTWMYPRTTGEASQGAVFNRANQYGLAMCDADATNCPSAPNSIQFFYPLWTSPGEWYTGANSIVLNAWNHLVVIYDKSSDQHSPIIYINGSRVAVATSSAPSGGFGIEGYNIRIGNNGNSFDGKIDEFRVYNRALNPAEVRALYETTGAGVSSSYSQGFNTSLTSGLVGHWTMDRADSNNPLSDSSGNGNHAYFASGDARDATSTAVGIGKIGQALRLPRTGYATSTYPFVYPSASLNNLSLMTISAWIYVDPNSQSSNPSYQAIYSKATNGTQPADAPVFVVERSDNVNRLLFGLGYNDFSTAAWTSSNNGISLGEWVHVMVSFDTGNISNDPVFYINGVATSSIELAPPSVTGTRDDSSWPVTVGIVGQPGFFGSIFMGRIDDMRVYNRILTSAEAKQLYNLGGQKIAASSDVLTRDTTLVSGLQGHWTFDGPDITTNAILDKSGNGRHGGYKGGATSSAKTIGKLGQALKFDGQNTYVDVGNTSIPGEITLSAWAKISDFSVCSGGCEIMSNYNTSGLTGQFELNLNDTGEVGFSTGNSGVYAGGYTDSTPIAQQNRWYHIVLTRSSTTPRTADTVRIYVDGALQSLSGVFDTAAPPTAGFGKTSIGRNGDYTGLYFPGAIDDARIYSRELSASEVKQLYNLGR